MSDTRDGYMNAARLLPPELKNDALSVPSAVKQTAEEFRLRVGNPMTVLMPSGESTLARLTPESCAERAVTPADLSRMLEIARGASAYSAQAAIARGYVTVNGGCRVGLCGSAITDGGQLSGIRVLSSACIRIPRQQRGCAAAIYNELAY